MADGAKRLTEEGTKFFLAEAEKRIGQTKFSSEDATKMIGVVLRHFKEQAGLANFAEDLSPQAQEMLKNLKVGPLTEFYKEFKSNLIADDLDNFEFRSAGLLNITEEDRMLAEDIFFTAFGDAMDWEKEQAKGGMER